MAEKVFLAAFLFSALYLSTDCTVSSPGDQYTCGENLTIPWIYTEPEDMSTVVWHFIDSTNTSTPILIQAQGSAALVQGGFNIEHISNGKVKLINPTTANIGSYRITVTYSTSASAAINTLKVDFYRKPYGLSYTSLTSKELITITCNATYYGLPAAALYIEVNEVPEYGKVSDEVNKYQAVECCLTGGAAICLPYPCVTALPKEFDSTYLVITSIAVALKSVFIIVLIVMIIVGQQGKVVLWNLSGADIAVIILDCVFASYSLIVGAVSVDKNVRKEKYCDTKTNCTASFGLGIASIVLAVVDVVVLVVFIIKRKGGSGERLSCLNTVLPVCKDTETRGPPDGKSDHPAAKEKHREVKLLTHKEQTQQHHRETEVNKGKHEEVFKGRPLPNPTGNNRDDTGSAGAVSRQDVVLDRRPMPEIPSDRHKRGLSANFNDDRDKPLDDNIVHTLPVVKKPKTALDPMNAEDQSKNADDQPKKKKKKKDRDTSRSEEMEDNIDSHGKVLAF